MRMGAGNKPVLFVKSMRHVKPNIAMADSHAAKPTDKPADGKPPATTTGNQTVTQRPTA